jgi:hypothetical protein
MNERNYQTDTENKAGLELSFYRTKDGNQSVQVLQDYYQMQHSEPSQNTRAVQESLKQENSDDFSNLSELTNKSVIQQLKKQKKQDLFFWRKKEQTHCNEFTQLDNIFHEARHMQDQEEQVEILTTLSIHIDDMVDKVENQCFTKAGFLSMILTMIWFFPLSHYSIQMHASHPFLWNFIPPVLALGMVSSIFGGILVAKNYFLNKCARLAKYKHYETYLNRFFTHAS